MMRLKSSLFLIFSILWLSRVEGQTAGQTYFSALADEQAGQYSAALSKYERIRYFNPDTLHVQLYLHIGNCLVNAGEYYKAINSYDNALLADLHREHQNEIKMQKVKAFILARNMRLANVALKEVDTVKDAAARKEVLFYQGVAMFYMERYKDAETAWLKLTKNDPSKQEQIINLFKKNQRINRLKPGIAIALSIVLPGAGQIYAGVVKEGVNSLLLTGALFFLGYNTAVVYNVLNAVIAVGPWFIRYYQGGFLRAGDIVRAKRAQRHDQVYRQILEVLK
jgi:tetratricopeptide (TPR) repeat protein